MQPSTIERLRAQGMAYVRFAIAEPRAVPHRHDG